MNRADNKKWVRREARYRIVDLVASAIAGADLLAHDHGYSDEEYNEITAEIRRVLARHERYASALVGSDEFPGEQR
jgi:hypothetical protein